ncbi:MAG: hypothetical protein L0215_01385 [Gemmataceae bacterium]|nr:hypothetical protein [Gemmataceae bacterium]
MSTLGSQRPSPGWMRPILDRLVAGLDPSLADKVALARKHRIKVNLFDGNRVSFGIPDDLFATNFDTVQEALARAARVSRKYKLPVRVIRGNRVLRRIG